MGRAVRSVFGILILFSTSWTASADAASAEPLTTAQIVERNVSARGGLEAWRALTTLTMAGTLYAGTKANAELPIVVQLKRPNMSRLEVDVHGHRLVQAFDGKTGWKIRPLRGRDIVAPYSPDDVFAARVWGVFAAPPLIDLAHGTTRVVFDGTDVVDGAPAYLLKVFRPDRGEQRVWVDARSFLDVKYDDTQHSGNGVSFTVTTYYHQYRTVDGVRIPTSIEVVAGGAQESRKMVFKDVAINPSLPDGVFSRPASPGRAAVLHHAAPAP